MPLGKAGSVSAANIVIQATDNASNIIQGASAAMGVLGLKAQEVGTQVLTLGSQLTQVGTLTVAALGGVTLESFNTLSQAIKNVKEVLGSPVVKPFVQLIQEEAVAATQEMSTLSETLSVVGGLSGDFAKGFLGATSVLDRVEGKAQVAADRVGKAFQDSITNSFSAINIDFGGLKLPGLDRIATLVDQNIAGALTDTLLDKLVGTGPVENFAKNLIKNQTVTQFFPDFVSHLIGGSVVESVDSALAIFGADSTRSRIKEAFNFADSLAIPALEIPGVKINSQSLLQNIEGALSSTVLTQGIQRKIGSGPIANAVTTGIRQLSQVPLAQNILPQFLKDLSGGSFTEATKGLFVTTFTSGFKESFKAINSLTQDTAGSVGANVADKLINGLDEETKKKIASTKAILGSALDGIGERMVKGLGLGSRLPGLSQLFPELGALSKVDDILFGALSKGIGALVSTKLPRLFIPLVEGATDAVGNTGSKLVANAIASFFPRYLRGIVSSTVQEIGLSRGIFDQIFANIQPNALRGSIGAIGKTINDVLDSVKTGILGITGFTQSVVQTIINGLKGIDGVLSGTRSGISSLANFLTGFLTGLSSGITSSVGAISSGLSAIQGALPALTAALSPVGTIFTILKTGLIDAVGFIQSGFTALGSVTDGALGQIESGIGAIASVVDRFVGRLQSSIVPTIASLGGIFEAQINGIRTLIPGLFETIARGIESFNTLISGGTLLDNLAARVRGLAAPIDTVFASTGASLTRVFAEAAGVVDTGFNKIRQTVGDVFSGGIKSVDSFKLAISGAFAEVSSTLATIKGSVGGAAVSMGQVDGIIAGIQGAFTIAEKSATDFINTLITGVGGAETTLDGFVAGIQSSVAPIIGEAITSLNQVFANLGTGGVGAGSFIESIQNDVATAVTALQGYVTNIEGFANAVFEQVRGVANSALGQVIDLAGATIGWINQNFVPSLESAFNSVNEFFGGVFTEAFTELARNATAAFGGGFASQLLKQFAPALDAVDSFVVQSTQKLRRLSSTIADTASGIATLPGLFAGFHAPSQVFEALTEGAHSLFNGINQIGQSFFFFQQGFQSLQQLVSNGPFHLLIGQSIELRAQLLSTQASLAATNQVMQNGVAVTDPTKAINALQVPIEASINQLRTESLDLVGVTSQELVPLYQIIAGQIGQLGGSLKDVKNLTLDTAASLGTLGIPLYQARQEITSILQGQIDQNSALAKNVGLTNQQVLMWKDQGVLIDKLREKLSTFRAGNAIAAQTVSGVTSNIKEIIENVGRIGGEKLLNPVVKELNSFYEYLKANQGKFVEFISQISEELLKVGLATVDIIKTIAKSTSDLLGQTPLYLFKSLANGMESLGQAVHFTVEALQPAINVASEFFRACEPMAGLFLNLFLQFKSLEIGVRQVGRAFGIITEIFPFTRELLFLVDQRTGGLTNQFITMSKVVGTGGSAFLLLGQHLTSIPGAMDVITKSMGPLGGIFAGFIPQVAGIGIQVVGLMKLVPGLQGVLGNVLTVSPALVTAAKAFVTGPQVLGGALAPLGGLFDQLSDKLKVYAYAADRGAVLSSQLKSVLYDIGKAAAQQLISMGLLAGGAFLAFKAFDELVLKNEDLKQALGYVAQGLSIFAQVVTTLLTNPATGAAIAVGVLYGAIKLQLIPVVLELIGTTVTGWFMGLATALGGAAIAAGSTGGALGGLAAVLNSLKLTGMASGSTEAAAGFAALAKSVTSGNLVLQLQAGFATAGSVALGLLESALTAVGLGNTGVAASAGAASAGMAEEAAVATVASGGFGALATSIWSAVAGLAALLLPVVAVGAAIAAMGSIIYTGVGPLKGIATYAEETANTYQQQTDAIADAAFALGAKLSAAAKRQKQADADGVKLTDEQYKANAKLQSQGKLQVQSIDEQITALEEAKKERFADKEALEAQEKQLKTTKDALNKLTTEIKIAPKPLQELGTTYDQLAQKARGAEKAVTQSSGDPAIFKQKGKELIDITQKQLDLGQVSEEEARRRYSLLADNVYADQEIQLAAQEAITKAYDTELKKRTDFYDAHIAKLEADVTYGSVTEIEGARAVTKARDEELQAQLENAKSAHNERIKLIDEEEAKSLETLGKQASAAHDKMAAATPGSDAYKAAVKQYDSYAKQIEDLQSSSNNARQQEDLKYGNQQEKQRADQEKNAAEGAKRIIDEQQKELERSQKKAVDTVKIAQNDRLIAEEKLYNQGAISKAQYDEDKAKSSIKSAEAELNAEKAKQAQLEQLVATAATPKLRRDLEIQLRESRIKTTELTQKSLDTERQAYEAHIATVKSALERQSNTDQAKEEQRVRDGVEIREEADRKKADSTVKRLQQELALETKDKDKRAQLELQLQQALSAQDEAQMKERLKRVDNANTEQSTREEQQVRDGQIIREEAEARKAQSAITRIRTELNAEQDLDKRTQLKLQLEEAITKARETEVKKRVQLLENAANIEAATDERAVRQGTEIREEGEVHKANAAIKRIQAELSGEKDLDKQAKLKLELEEAVTKARDAEINKRLKLIEIANNEEQAQDEALYRTGKIRKEQLEVDKAVATVHRLEQELVLEKDNAEKRAAIELQLQQARTSLQEAQLAQRKQQIEEENQTYQNQLERQLEPLKAQQSIFDLLNKALENRNKLLSASKDLVQAGANYLTGELETISSVETSEYRRKQLAQGIAAIKLDAAKKEAEMTKASLEAEQQMQRFALMREQIENRIAIAKQVGETAKLQGQIAVAEADPRTTKAQREALYIQLDAAKQSQGQLQGIGMLMARQAPIQEQIFTMQKRSRELQADATVSKATADLINTLGPGAKERAARAFQEQESRRVFGTGYQDVRYGSRALARASVDETVPGARLGPGAGISAFAPYLEEFAGSASAMAQASSDFMKTIGPSATSGQGVVGVGAAPLKLPGIVGRVPGLEQVNKVSQDAIVASLLAYQQAGLKLPPATAMGQLQLPKPASDGLTKSSSTFEKAVGEFAKAVRSSQQQQQPKPTTGNVTLNVQQQQSADLATVLNYAKQLTGS